MKLTEQEKEGLGIALNEATLLGVEFERHKSIAKAHFSVLSLAEDDSKPTNDARRQICFFPVGRIAASLRNGNWDDLSAQVVPFQIEKLHEVVKSFYGVPIYGGEFFDVAESRFQYWANRLSVNYENGPDGLSHSITLFQEGTQQHLDLRIWFDEFKILNTKEDEISIQEFISGGIRWWDGFYKGDKRTMGQGMMPLTGKDDVSKVVKAINEVTQPTHIGWRNRLATLISRFLKSKK